MSCLFDTETNTTEFETIKPYRIEFEGLLKRMRPQLGVMETCSITGWVHDLCVKQGYEVLVADPSQEAWRGVPILPCNKIPITNTLTSSILVLRTGEEDEGVIGLHKTEIPDEYQPGLSVRFVGINEKAIMSYLVSAYYSAAI